MNIRTPGILFSRITMAVAPSIGSAALIVALSGIASRFLGFVRDRMLAVRFGAGDALDAYYAAFRIPDLLYGFIVLGALSAAFIPVFSGMRARGEEDRSLRLASAVLNIMLASLGGLSLLGCIFAPSLTTLLAPGFTDEKRELVIVMTRIMFLSPIILSVSAVFSGILMSLRRFLAYSLAPLFYNAGIIIGVLLFVPLFGDVGLAWGVVCGALLHMLIQLPSIRQMGFHYRLLLGWGDPAVRQVLRLMVPRSLGVGVNQVGIFVVTVFASFLTSGSLAAFTFANNIQGVVFGLFGIAFSVAAFPTLSGFMAVENGKDFFRTIADTTRRILFFVLPLSALLIIFRAHFVRLILGAGEFSWEDTALTFQALGILAFSLFAQSLIPLFSRAFFAMQNTRTPLYIALFSETIHILVLLGLFRLGVLSVGTLALAFSCAAILNVGLLYLQLRRMVKDWDDARIFTPALKIVGAAFLAGAIAQASKSLFDLTATQLDTFATVFLQLAVGSLIGGLSYALLCNLLRIEELSHLRRYILCRILRQPEAVAAVEGSEKSPWSQG